ncbi:MAG: hypothetical protein SF187_10755 [Deltaproteobacteria bacterium]|nr:hypothetical protein [Deltaproteobacteria bacterium]
MANLVVYTELAEDRQPTPGARFALAQARLIARALGATIHAAVAHPGVDTSTLDEIAAALGGAGADRVLLWSNAAAGALPLYVSHGAFLEAMAKQLRPRLFIFAAGSPAVQLAPVLASRLPAEFFPRAQVTVGPANLDVGDVGTLRLQRVASDNIEQLDVIEAERMVVVTLCNGTTQTVTGGQPAELEVMDLPAQAELTVQTTRLLANRCEDASLLLGDGPGRVSADEARLMYGMLCPQHAVLFTNDIKAWWPVPLMMSPGSAFGWVGDQALARGTRGLTARWRINAQVGWAAWQSARVRS